MHTLINNITLNDLIKSYLGVLRGMGHYTVASTSGLYPASAGPFSMIFFLIQQDVNLFFGIP